MDTIYVEDEIRDHPRTVRILEKFAAATVIPCERFGEVFNPRAQNFRLQKQRPALILAKKYGKLVLPTPPDYSIGAAKNVYFSHMLNCLYDCRYCFLQGMYSSANYVHFVNFDDFKTAIRDELETAADFPVCFFSGYDCDSLALENLTGFAAEFLPVFAGLDPEKAWLELRTKSVNVRPLLEYPGDPLPNVIPAFSLTPDSVAREIEHGAPPVAKRINRVHSLIRQGWFVGLRLDPLIACENFEDEYRGLIESIFSELKNPELIHSVTLGPLRFPKKMHRKIAGLYPGEPVLADPKLVVSPDGKRVAYADEMEREQEAFVMAELGRFLPVDRIFVQED
ncbi:MAG: DNA photolyase [Verrucomicrobiales bacterium]|nr:DNA photolyase [Verrucomicrobiales bacterium]